MSENNPEQEVAPENVTTYTVSPELMERLFLIIPVPPIPLNEEGVIDISSPGNTQVIVATLVDTFSGPMLLYSNEQEAIIDGSSTMEATYEGVNDFPVPDSSSSSEAVHIGLPDAFFEPTFPAPAGATRVEPTQVSSSLPPSELEFVTMQPVELNLSEQANLTDPLEISDETSLSVESSLTEEASLTEEVTVSEEVNSCEEVGLPERVNLTEASEQPSSPQKHLVLDMKCLCSSCYSELVDSSFTEIYFIKRATRNCAICKQSGLMKYYQDICFPCSRRRNLCMRCLMFEIDENNFFDFDALLIGEAGETFNSLCSKVQNKYIKKVYATYDAFVANEDCVANATLIFENLINKHIEKSNRHKK